MIQDSSPLWVTFDAIESAAISLYKGLLSY
jgi:hypothetical protein